MRAILQRHGKIIMTILGIALMFIFALPTFQAPSQDPTKILVGKLNGHKVSQDDLAGVNGELNLYDRLRVETPNFLEPDQDSDRAIYWYLMCQEARRYGAITVTDAEAHDQLISTGRDEADIDGLMRTLRPGQLGAAISDLETVGNYVQFLARMPESVASMELSADRVLSKIQVAFAMLDANKNWEPAAAPTDEQIKKQLDLYKDVVKTPIPPAPIAATTQPADEPAITPPPPLPPLIDGHHYPFGYKYPDRVAVDYLVFNRKAIKAGMKLTQEDIDNADKYYFNHPDEFRNNQEASTATSQPATQAATQSATQPAIKPLSEVQDMLRERQIDARVTAVLKKMTDRVLAQAAEPWKSMPSDDKGFRQMLPREQWADYSKLADDISKSRDFGGYKPDVQSTKNLLDAEGLSALPGIGGASYRVPNQGQDYSFAELATHVRELVELKAKNPLGRLFLQTGVEVQQPLQDNDGNLYIFRVTTAEKTHDPATAAEVAEVRPHVIEDLKKLETYKKLETQAKELAGRVHNAFELSALSEQQKLPEKTTPPFSRLDQSDAPAAAAIRGFVDAAFNLANSAATQPATQAATQPSTQAKTADAGTASTLENEESLRVFVLQMVSHTPATGGDFGEHRRELFQQADSGLGAFLRSYLSLDGLAARLKFVPDANHPFSKPKKEE